jgi:tetratricopeptide (TPR) repeat protein/DNA-binding Xre family transcriptional regulator
MPRTVPPPLSLALTHLRTMRGWTQQDLAAAAGVTGQLICDLEKGTRRTLHRDTLEGLVARMGYAPEDVTLALLFQGGTSAASRDLRLSPVEPSPADLRRARRLAARVGLAETSRLYEQLLELARARRVELARRRAAGLWESLRRCPPARLRELIARSSELHDWALAERLCDESERAAAGDAARALHLAWAALRAAELSPGDGPWRSRLQGYCWPFVGNAQRVGSDFATADASFATAWRLWRAGGPGAAGPLGEWRLLDLEASLRRDQRRFAAAFELLDRALVAAPATARGRILLKKQFTHEQAGEIEAALATLEEAAPLVEATADPNLHWSLRMNRVVMLAHLGRFAEAEAHLPELRGLAIELGRLLDLTRLVWLGGRIAAGLGRRDEARAALSQARREFAASSDGYNAALVALELVCLLLDEGRAAEAATLADEMVAIFSSLRVERETLAALNLFCRAARAHTATAEMARELLASLERSRAGEAARGKEPE